MQYDFSGFKKKIETLEEWLHRELSTVRTGRATPAILDTIRVDSYGAKVPINHIAGVSVEDSRTIRVTAWDKNQNKDIENAIISADLGLSVSSDDQGLRVIFPELTAERREALLKVVNTRLEDARVSLRQTRDEVWQEIQEREKSGALSEDEKFRSKTEMQKFVDSANKTMDESVEKKRKEISN